MKKYLIVALLASLLAGCAHDSPCVPVYDSQGRLVHTNTCMKGTTEDNWDTAGAIGSRPHVRDRRADSLDRFPNRRYRSIACICSTPFPEVSDNSGSS